MDERLSSDWRWDSPKSQNPDERLLEKRVVFTLFCFRIICHMFWVLGITDWLAAYDLLPLDFTFLSIFINSIWSSSEIFDFQSLSLMFLRILLILLEFLSFSNRFSSTLIDFIYCWSMLRAPKWLPCWIKKLTLTKSRGSRSGENHKKFEGLGRSGRFLNGQGGCIPNRPKCYEKICSGSCRTNIRSVRNMPGVKDH